MPPTPTLVVGTAGHIDHGKSRLVLALTGTDPDRLPEEQARGMTIDLGFAHREHAGCVLSFVDVPGHERFIRNMVAGATGVDVALLVVAADDSVMPQTREHAEVLSLLGIERSILVLTKMDLVDEEWAAAVEEEARELLQGAGITPLACVRTSAQTGRGIGELLEALVRVARDSQAAAPLYRWFRLPIDRAFSIAGRGTVATGSVSHGAIEREVELELWPAGERVRVRDLQIHNDEREAAAGRMRLGVNLAGVALERVQRGHELASPGSLRPTQCLDVGLTQLRMPGKTRRQKLRLRLHIATSDVLAELRLAEPPAADPVRGVYAQLHIAEPIVAAWGQRFILRDEAATRTLGGGRVLRPFARPWTARRPVEPAGLKELGEAGPRERLAEVIRDLEWDTLPEALLASAAGLADAADAGRLVRSLLDRGTIVTVDRRAGTSDMGAHRMLVHRSRIEALAGDLDRRLGEFLRANPRAAGVPRWEWPAWMPHACPERWRGVLGEWLIGQGLVGVAGEHVVPQGHKTALPPQDEALYTRLLAEFEAGGFQPPAPAALACREARNSRRIDELIDLAAARGDLLHIAEDLWLHARRWDELVHLVAGALRERKLTVAEIRTLLNSTRKFVVPIVERLDALGITRRVGDFRMLGPKAAAATKA